MVITFFIPAYNCSKTIGESVDSIMNTNFADGDELIITNDGSIDNTHQVLEELKQKYPNIKIINHRYNRGGSAARNSCIENSINELLFCLDSDNILAPYSISPLKDHLVSTKSEAASFQHQHFFIDNVNNIVKTWSAKEGEVPLDFFLNGSNVPGQHGNYLFTKASWLLAGGYVEGVGALDTWTFGLKQAIAGVKFTVLLNSCYYHRLDKNSSYWMRNAESNLHSVSLKATIALIPLFEKIDERFINRMLGKNKYDWFYMLKQYPIKLIDPNEKKKFYDHLHSKIYKKLYLKTSFYNQAMKLLKKLHDFR